MYDSESSVRQKKNESRTNAVKMQSQRHMCGVSRKDRCINSYVRERYSFKEGVVTRVERGYYVHIRSVEEVQQQVLKYINVIARPMILNGTQPPPTWTHAATDHTRTKAWDVSKDVNMPNEDKLVTSVAIPAFDYRYNEEHKNDTMLLGVAGTDVPIDSIAKLAQPHQLGVNGYSFIVSNNGYLLLHPLLITSINEKLQKNYNSVDFVEVEQIDDGNGARILGEEILRLREKLVNGVPGYELDLPVLYHYDNMRRLARVRHDYYFKNLEGTPFSIGISLPKVYGDTELLLKDNPEALKGQNLTGINVTDYFRYSYRVHPDWVYCKFHYLEGHETNHPEMEIWNFLVNISHTKADISRVQYNSSMHSLPFNASTHCGSATSALGKDDYYCNEDLVKQLVFDAKLSEPYFKEWNPREAERVLADKYNVSVRFIATSSGLTRWHYIHDDSKNERVDDEGERHREYIGKVFGDLYPNTIEETWYKAAVLQHTISKYSLVISTPLPILDDIIDKRPPVVNDDGDITMTASYAIFYKDGVGPSSETPASVVGFQFSYLSLFEVFSELTNTGQDIRCNGTDFACYIIDSSGYVVLSGQISDVGTFFGVLEPGVMQSFLDKDIFTNVTVFNYQALCSTKSLKKKSNSSWSLATPFSAFKSLIQWILWEAIILLSSVIDGSYAQPLDGYVEASTTEAPPEEDQKAAFKEKKVDTFSCDHEINLYIMNQSHFLQDEMALSPVVYEDQPTDCNPAYWAAYMMKVNWMVIAVQKENWGKKGNCTIPPTTKPIPTNNSIDSLEPCHKLDLANLNRRRLEGCYTYHEKERNITECGRGSRLGVGLGTPLAIMVLALATSFLS
ncbi:hypothetical protein EVAR_21132_1 [Eumeta japonica]|uniref:Voltage-dependent calcium channel alpha-2/delta subunit conserved region domain-containing protein n=1 Tax=Eumeta variegata TaxID=151549 RepID=A0A4C1VSP0_EUMVA|nr:hypothetical protein EVAR_21132_1 [Eumeta japonica]